jgi:hypothetical protein
MCCVLGVVVLDTLCKQQLQIESLGMACTFGSSYQIAGALLYTELGLGILRGGLPAH